MRGISWLAEELSASQYRLCFMGLASTARGRTSFRIVEVYWKITNDVPGTELNVNLWFEPLFIVVFVYGCKESPYSIITDSVSQLIIQLIIIITALNRIIFYERDFFVFSN